MPSQLESKLFRERPFGEGSYFKISGFEDFNEVLAFDKKKRSMDLHYTIKTKVSLNMLCSPFKTTKLAFSLVSYSANLSSSRLNLELHQYKPESLANTGEICKIPAGRIVYLRKRKKISSS